MNAYPQLAMMNAKIVPPYYGINNEKEKETYFSCQVVLLGKPAIPFASS